MRLDSIYFYDSHYYSFSFLVIHIIFDTLSYESITHNDFRLTEYDLLNVHHNNKKKYIKENSNNNKYMFCFVFHYQTNKKNYMKINI